MTCTSTPSEALARQLLWATLGRLLLAPDRTLEDTLRSGILFDGLTEALRELSDTDLVTELAAAHRAWDEGAADADGATRYNRVFGHALSPDYPPYETQYGLAHPFHQSERLADLVGFYRSFGLTVSPALHDRADHLGVEFEFMGFLAAKEAYHLERGEELHRDATRAGARFFLEHHAGPATLAFAERVTRYGPDGFYKQVARLCASWVRHEAARVQLTGLDNPLELVHWDDAIAEEMAGEVAS